jgi:hypothetical protein
MTVISEGYPDWQRVETRAFDPFYRETFDTGGSTASTGLLYVANFPMLIVSAKATGTSIYNMTLQWYTDSDKSTSLLTEQIGLAAPDWGYRVAHGVVSPWLDVFFVPTTYSSGDEITLALIPSTFQIPQIQLSYNYLIRETTLAIGSGVTTTVNANAIIPGPGKLYLHNPTCTDFTVNMQVLENDGAWHSSFFAQSTTVGVTLDYDVTLPPRPTRVQVDNRSGSSANFDFTLSSWAQ